MKSYRVLGAVVTILVASILVMPVSESESTVADVENQFAAVCLHNDSGIHLNYSVKWADDDEYTRLWLYPGESSWHSFRYPSGSRRSPGFYVRFDYDLRDWRSTPKFYELERYRVPFQSCEFAKVYAFKRTGDFIDIYPVN